MERTNLLKKHKDTYGAVDGLNGVKQQKNSFWSKRDCIIVTVLSVIVIVTITLSLIFGIKAINRKEARFFDLTTEPSASILHSFQSYAVSTDADYCAPIGSQIINQGGSAVDAAIATLFCGGAVHPQAMGIGGGVFFTIFDKKSNNVTIIDGREAAPLGAEQIDKNDLKGGPLSIAIPGELQAYERAHKLFGKLPWKDVVQPTIDLCRKGFKITDKFHSKLVEHKAKLLNSTLKNAYYNVEKGRLLDKGEVMKCEELASTLEIIRDEGPLTFYEGSLAQQIVQDLRNASANITIEDLNSYQVRTRTAVNVTLKSKSITIFAPPAPAAGPIVSAIVNILDGYNHTAQDLKNVSTAGQMYHRLAEAFKFAFAAKTHLSDEDFLSNETIIDYIVSNAFAEDARSKIDEQTHDREFYSPYHSPLVEDHGTANTNVLTNDMAVAASSSINGNFGSYVRLPKSGIIFNNHMADFSTDDNSPNSVKVGKRPLSSMCPTVAVDSETLQPLLVVGGAGHSRITTGVAQILLRYFYLDQDVKQAIDAPRLHHSFDPDELYYQEGFPGVLIKELEKRKHKVLPESEPNLFSAISRDKSGRIQANSDYRTSGSVSGL